VFIVPVCILIFVVFLFPHPDVSYFKMLFLLINYHIIFYCLQDRCIFSRYLFPRIFPAIVSRSLFPRIIPALYSRALFPLFFRDICILLVVYVVFVLQANKWQALLSQ
jgi:hypothetical protein